MNFLEAIHQGDLTAVRQQLAENPALLNQADAQGNTPLHYAVAQHDLTLIEFLIHQGSEVTAKNHLEETARDWYEEFFTSLNELEKLIDSKELQQVIERNSVKSIEAYLKFGGSRSLRFSRGSTLLHLAVELQRPTIVKVILSDLSPEKIKRLLKLKNSQGVTPLDLKIDRLLELKNSQGVMPLDLAPQNLDTHATTVAQEIFTVLQEKPRDISSVDSASISQPLPTAWPFFIDKAFKNRVNELSNTLKNPITVADFEQLNPWRVVICQLAYITCYQALARLSKFKRQVSLEETLLHNLFGNQRDNTRFDFQKKLQAIVDYLVNLIQQQQVNQVIHFSNKKPHANGWCCFEEKKIYLNPMAEKTNLITVVIALIHETTHKVNHSYDFVTMEYSLGSKGYTIDFNQFYQLVSTGKSEELTPERVKPFELRQLLQEGLSSPDWQQHLNHWMAQNNADTQTLAILLLATLPENYAKFDKKQYTLLIKPEFLSAEYLKQHPVPLPLITSPLPVPEPPMAMATQSSDDQQRASSTASSKQSLSKRIANRFKQKAVPEAVSLGSPRSDHSGVNGECPSASRRPSPPMQLLLLQTMAAQSSSADQTGPSRTTSTNESFFNPLKKSNKQEFASPRSPGSELSDGSGECSTIASSTTLSPSVKLPEAMAATSLDDQPGSSRTGPTNLFDCGILPIPFIPEGSSE